MRFLILTFIFISSLFASEIINITYYNYSNQNKVVVLFSLDSPFKGKIEKINKDSYLITNVKTSSVETKQFKNIINNVVISPRDENSVVLKVSSNNKFSIKASVTKIGYGLKLTILSKVATTKEAPLTMPNVTTNNTNSFNMLNYMLVIGILIILIIVLLVIKKKGIQIPTKAAQYEYKVIFKRAIDTKNSLMMIEVMGVKYLLMVGTSNVLLNVIDGDSNNINNEMLNIEKHGFDNVLGDAMDNDNMKNSFIANASKIKEN